MTKQTEQDPVKCGCDEFPECTHALYWYQGYKAGAASPVAPAPREYELLQRCEHGAIVRLAPVAPAPRLRGIALLKKLANGWIETGQFGKGLRTDEYVTAHREAIMGIYEHCGKQLLEYLSYEEKDAAALAPVATWQDDVANECTGDQNCQHTCAAQPAGTPEQVKK